MEQLMVRLAWVLPLVGITMRSAAGEMAQPPEMAIAIDGDHFSTVPSFDMTVFAEEVARVNQAIAREAAYSRDDLLAMYGRSAAASGRFDVAAAAYAMFLNEFGTDHPYSEKIATRLADCLFPFKYDQIDVLHSAAGPRLEPAWRMGFSPRPDHLRLAVPAFGLAATLALDGHAKGSALLKLGWVHRVLGDWPAATAAWEHCAADAAGTRVVGDALRLAAENQRWTGHPAEAAELLGRLQRDATKEAAKNLAEEIEALNAEALRDEQWLNDPVAGLQGEIENRPKRSPEQVFQEAMNWLAQRGEQSARLAVARWGMAQGDWSGGARLAAHLHAADALLATASPSAEAKVEAADVLRQLTDIAPSDSWLVSTAMRRSALLRQIGASVEAATMWKEVAMRMQRPWVWSGQVLPERIRVSLAAKDRASAEQLLEQLEQDHPEHAELDALRTMLGISEEGE